MNHFHAKAEWINGAWRAMVRYSHKADYWPVMDGEKPARYPTKAEAEIAALRAQERHMNGTIRGFGEKAEAARIEANKIFRLGKKPVVFESRKKRA
jgi:hypothetical protein